jgi:hypothetical protein
MRAMAETRRKFERLRVIVEREVLNLIDGAIAMSSDPADNSFDGLVEPLVDPIRASRTS